MKKFRSLSLVLFLLIINPVTAEDEDDAPRPVTLHYLEDFPQDAERMKAGKMPMLLAFVADFCPYCETVKEEFLKPMLRSGDYTDKAVIRQLDISSGDYLVAVNGKEQPVSDFASGYDIFVTPTVLFLDAGGKEISERVIGVTTVDFYGGFLDDGIDDALKALGNPLRLRP